MVAPYPSIWVNYNIHIEREYSIHPPPPRTHTDTHSHHSAQPPCALGWDRTRSARPSRTMARVSPSDTLSTGWL